MYGRIGKKEEKNMEKTQDKYSWDLTDLFKDKEEFYKEMKNVKDKLKQIETYKGILCDRSENLYHCYQLYEEVLMKFEQVYAYGMLNYHLNMADQEGIKLFKKVENLNSEFGIATAYITPEITFADENIINQYLQEDPRLEPYKRDIQKTLEKKKHILSKEGENLLANYSEILCAPKNIYDLLTNAEFKFGTLIDEEGKEVELTDATYSIYIRSKNQNVRKQAYDLVFKKYGEFINTIAEIYITNVKKTVITAKLRNYESSLDEVTDNDEVSLKVYDTLMEGVHKGLTANHDYMALKKKLLHLENMHMYDIYVNPFTKSEDKIPYEEAKKIVKSALAILGKEYGDMLEHAFENHWIDVYEKPNKQTGGYNMGIHAPHPFILMNYVGDEYDVRTIAHELGHSMHTYYANKNQNIFDADYTIMVGEVASTVNEILLTEYQLQNETDKTKKAEIIYELLELIRGTFYAQAMFAEFETEVHEKIENGKMVSAEDLNMIYYDLNQKYMGKAVTIEDNTKYGWSRIPHFYRDFYVYKYATGISSAICIATKILNKEEGYVEKYINMLSQGCTRKSIDLLKMVDVDLEDIHTYDSIVQFYRNKIEELESLT